MADAAAVSAVMRQLAAQRWRGQLPARLARELLPRVQELPPSERTRLLNALTEPQNPDKPPPLTPRGATCDVCGEPLAVVKAGQTSHPGCED